jgi:hypothetical protein
LLIGIGSVSQAHRRVVSCIEIRGRVSMRLSHFSSVLLFSAALALSASPAMAQGHGHGRGQSEEHGHGNGHRRGHGRGHKQKGIAFTQRDRDVLSSYLRGRRSGLPPGLAKRDALPPGLQRQIERTGHLPPGLEKRLRPFPPELQRRMPPLPENCGCRYGFVGTSAVIVNPKTGAVLDMIRDIFILAH